MESIIDILGSTFGVALPFLVVLGVVIFVHEFGHYIVGRWSGIHAEAFSLGFGGEALGWTDRRGTRWRLSWVPLGGYVLFKGDASAASTPDAGAIEALTEMERRQTLHGAPLWARTLTVAAGPLANFILSAILVMLLGLAIGRASDAPVLGDVAPDSQASRAGFESGDRIVSVDGRQIGAYRDFISAMFQREGETRDVVVERDGARTRLDAAFSRPPRVESVSAGGPAAEACVKPGDLIQTANGQDVGSFVDLQRIVQDSDGEPIELEVLREGATQPLSLTPRRMERPNPQTGAVETVMMIGVSARFNLGVEPSRESMGALEAVGFGLNGVWRVISGTFGYLGALISSDADGSSLSGPLGIAQASGQAAESGFVEFVGFIATVSAAIGLLNLFPIPLLDGGHLLFYGVEAVIGRPVSDRSREAAAWVGIAAITFLIVFATQNDLGKIFAGIGVSC